MGFLDLERKISNIFSLDAVHGPRGIRVFINSRIGVGIHRNQTVEKRFFHLISRLFVASVSPKHTCTHDDPRPFSVVDNPTRGCPYYKLPSRFFLVTVESDCSVLSYMFATGVSHYYMVPKTFGRARVIGRVV